MADLVSRDDVLKAISDAECQYYWGAEALEAATKIIRALPAVPSDDEVERLRSAAERVCWFDWSDSDSDAVEAIGYLRAALYSAPRATTKGE